MGIMGMRIWFQLGIHIKCARVLHYALLMRVKQSILGLFFWLNFSFINFLIFNLLKFVCQFQFTQVLLYLNTSKRHLFYSMIGTSFRIMLFIAIFTHKLYNLFQYYYYHCYYHYLVYYAPIFIIVITFQFSYQQLLMFLLFIINFSIFSSLFVCHSAFPQFF